MGGCVLVVRVRLFFFFFFPLLLFLCFGVLVSLEGARFKQRRAIPLPSPAQFVVVVLLCLFLDDAEDKGKHDSRSLIRALFCFFLCFARCVSTIKNKLVSLEAKQGTTETECEVWGWGCVHNLFLSRPFSLDLSTSLQVACLRQHKAHDSLERFFTVALSFSGTIPSKAQTKQTTPLLFSSLLFFSCARLACVETMEVVELAPLLTEQQAKHSCQPGRPGVEAIQTQHRFMMAGLVRQLSQVSAYAADIMDSECVGGCGCGRRCASLSTSFSTSP